jgi:membrane protein YqaA with SNARE-associated domain
VAGYLAMAAVVFAVNLLPAFGPPTWAVLVLFHLTRDLAPVPLVLVGALAAATGRLVLAMGTRRLKPWLPQRYVANAESAGRLVTERRRAAITGLALFAISPLPSAQLFEAAGLAGVRLVPLTAAFFVGRLVSYSIYVAGAAALKETNLGQLVADSLRSPWGIAVEVLLLAGLVLLGRVDWSRFAPQDDNGTPSSASSSTDGT